METKFCVKCSLDKPINEFYLKSNGKHHSWCNDCRRLKKREWDLSHREHIFEYKIKTKQHRDRKNKEYKDKNKNKIKQNSYIYNERLKEKRKKDRESPLYKAKRKIYERQWRKENKEHFNKYFHDYYEKNPVKKIVRNMRQKARKIFKGDVSPIHSCDMFGCELDFFKKHIESQFKDGMNWGNYGYGEDKWCIDHTPPLASYDYSNPDNFKVAFHWSHCSPKWLLDNISKNSWYGGVRHYYKNKQ